MALLTQKGCYYLLINCIVYNVHPIIISCQLAIKKMLSRIHGAIIYIIGLDEITAPLWYTYTQYESLSKVTFFVLVT